MISWSPMTPPCPSSVHDCVVGKSASGVPQRDSSSVGELVKMSTGTLGDDLGKNHVEMASGDRRRTYHPPPSALKAGPNEVGLLLKLTPQPSFELSEASHWFDLAVL